MNYWKEHSQLRIILMLVTFVLGLVLIVRGWMMTGQMAGLGWHQVISGRKPPQHTFCDRQRNQYHIFNRPCNLKYLVCLNRSEADNQIFKHSIGIKSGLLIHTIY